MMKKLAEDVKMADQKHGGVAFPKTTAQRELPQLGGLEVLLLVPKIEITTAGGVWR